jgi:hypothetical protein
MRTRKDINQTNPDGQHLEPTVSLINAVETTCQGNSWTMFYCQRFSKSSKKFNLNSRGTPFSGAKEKVPGKQHDTADNSTTI